MNGIQVSNIYTPHNALNTKISSAPDKIKKSESKKDEVALSNTAKDYGTVSKILSSLPDIRQEVVSGLKARYNAGTYNIPADEIASKIVNKWASLD